MELKRNNYTENIEDIDSEMQGRKMIFPMCIRCKYSNGDMCEKYHSKKVDLEEIGIDIFHCPGFKEKELTHSEEKMKELGFIK